MKKFILTSACVLAATGAAFAQGAVQWTTISFGFVTFETNTTASSFVSPGGSGPLSGGATGLTVGGAAGSFYYELLYSAGSSKVSAPTTLAGLDSWTDSGLEADNSATSGRLQVLNASGSADEPFTTASVVLVGWSANLGTTWSAASTILNSPTALSSVVGTALFGETSTGFITLAPQGNPIGTNPFGSPGIQSLLTPLYVVATPEPTTIALGVMGAASLLALRRKKA